MSPKMIDTGDQSPCNRVSSPHSRSKYQLVKQAPASHSDSKKGTMIKT